MKKLLPFFFAVFFLASCGGGGGSPGACIGGAGTCGNAQNQGTNQQTAISAWNGEPPGTPASLANVCTDEGEKKWIRAHLDDVYLWYDQIVNTTPSLYTIDGYFYSLLVRSRDRFSFVASQAQMDQFFQAGQEVGYGLWYTLTNDGKLRITQVDAGSPAAQNAIARGAEILAINGTAFSGTNAQIAALFPSSAGTSNQFTIKDVGAATNRTVTLSATVISKSPVPITSVLNVAGGQKVGYMVFNDHVATAEQPLINAMTQFQQAGINDLVLDVRYNGGGYLYIASQLAAMIGGTAVDGKIFEKLVFNSRHTAKTNNPGNQLPFLATSLGGTPLPKLNLARVFVLTGPDTCSASEAIINGLMPFVQVIRIGGYTCGKPYGFIQTDNCARAYFATQFEGVNHNGDGGYTNGFTPTCNVADDLEHQLGDTNERLLANALGYRTSGSCPALAMAIQSNKFLAATKPPRLPRPEWRDIKLVK